MSPWTEDEISFCESRWKAGFSGAQIAASLRRSRNSVIGKVHRMQWAGGTEPPVRVKRKHVVSKRVSGGALGLKLSNGTFGKHWTPVVERPEPRPVKDIPKPISRAIPLLELGDKTCRYPDGGRNEPAHSFCGHTVFELNVYCEYHFRVCYQPPQRRRDRQPIYAIRGGA